MQRQTRSISNKANVIVTGSFYNVNTFLELSDLPRLDLEWQMTRCERFAQIGLLERVRPALSLEIGTYRGSLQVLSRFSSRVISVDIDPPVAIRLGSHFSNVEFLAGDSGTVLPNPVSRLKGEGSDVGFILIDGVRSDFRREMTDAGALVESVVRPHLREDGVRATIEFLARHQPRIFLPQCLNEHFYGAATASP